MPDEFRLMLLLACVEGFKYEEVAQVMGCPIGTVMSRLFRARRQLRKDLTNVASRSRSGESEKLGASMKAHIISKELGGAPASLHRQSETVILGVRPYHDIHPQC